MYRFDATYALEVYKQHPGRFGLVKPVDPTDPAVAEVIAEWKRTPGTIGIRIMLNREPSTDPDDPGLNRVLAEAAKHDLPVNMLIWGRLEQAAGLAARNPSTQIVIDHIGLQQPFEPPAPPAPWADVPKILGLAAGERIAGYVHLGAPSESPLERIRPDVAALTTVWKAP